LVNRGNSSENRERAQPRKLRGLEPFLGPSPKLGINPS